MSANNIVGGTGNNNFSPKAASTSEQAISVASATREQSLLIAVRMVENLKDKPVPYTQGAAPTPTSTPPTTPTPTPPPATTSPSGDTSLVGFNWNWMHGPGSSATRLIFYSNGEFIQATTWTTATYSSGGMIMGGIPQWRERHKGTYSTSNGMLTLTYTLSERCEKPLLRGLYCVNRKNIKIHPNE